jgi:membrane associated rhomboid family serine protease
MFFPVGDQNIVKGNKPILTYFLLAINIAIFVFQFSLSPQAQQEFVFTYGSIPR